SSSAQDGSMPLPPAAFSPFAITKSIGSARRSCRSTTATPRRPGRPTTSPKKTMRIDRSVRRLARARLANDGDLDLSRVRHLLLDPSRDVARQEERLIVRDRARIDDHPDLAARLDRERPLHAFERVADLLEVLETLGVALQPLPARPGTRPRDRIRRIHERS